MKKFDVGFACLRLALDSIMIYAGLIMAYGMRMFGYGFLGLEAPETLIPFVIHSDFSWKITAVLIVVLILNGRYNIPEKPKKTGNFLDLFWAFSAGIALVLVFFFFSQIHFFSRLIFGLAWVLSFSLLLCSDQCLNLIKKQIWQKGWGQVSVLLLGTGVIADKIKHELNANHKYLLLEQVQEKDFGKLEKLIKKHAPQKILVATESVNDITIGELAHIAHKNHLDFGFVPDELALDLASVSITSFGKMPLMDLKTSQLTGWAPVFKSVFDKLFALTALLILSPVMIGIMIKIWWKDKKAPVFYRSERVGQNGNIFKCIKFRSMVPDAEAKKAKLIKKNQRKGGVLFKMKDDPRITPFGKLLRKWSLDELPQLVNILIGDMSLIGPRPHLPEEVKQYSEKQQYLLGIKPGLSGYAQISSIGNEKLSFSEEMRYELLYLKKWSFWLDIVILFKTIALIVRGKNY